MNTEDVALGQARKLLNRRLPNPGQTLLDTLDRDGVIIAPGCYSPQGASIATDIWEEAQKTGKPCCFNAVYGSGWAVSAMDRRQPDFGFHDRTEIVKKAGFLVRGANTLPLIMDAEAGFGGPMHIPELVEAYTLAGVALGHLEDQQGDKRRCGHLAGRAVVPIPDFQEKLHSWLTASVVLESNMLLMVRTDAISAANGGFDNAVERMKRYLDVEVAGRRAAFAWAEFDTPDPEQIARWAQIMREHDPDVHLAINYSPNKDWPQHARDNGLDSPLTYMDMREMGFKLIFHTILEARIAMEAVYNGFAEMAVDGERMLWNLQDRQRGTPAGKPQALSGAPEWMAFERLIGGEEAAVRQDQSGGYRDEDKTV